MGLTSIPVALAAFNLDHPSLARARPAPAAPARGPCGPEVFGPRPAVQILRAMAWRRFQSRLRPWISIISWSNPDLEPRLGLAMERSLRRLSTPTHSSGRGSA
jgi:hypothetical protein